MKTKIFLTITGIFLFSHLALAQLKQMKCNGYSVYPGGSAQSPDQCAYHGYPNCVGEMTILEGDSVRFYIVGAGGGCSQPRCQWYHDGVPIPGATSMDFIAKEPGQYTAWADGDFTRFLNNINLKVTSITGVSDPQPQKVSITPSLATSVLHVETQKLQGRKHIDIYNMQGQNVKSLTMDIDLLDIDISDINFSQIIVVLRDETGKTWTQRVVKAME